MTRPEPLVLLLDGDYPHSVSVARELHTVLGARVAAAATSPNALGVRSRHSVDHVPLPNATHRAYGKALLAAVGAIKPDVVVPVGFFSTAKVVALRESGRLQTAAVAPDASSFAIGEDKVRTYEAAQSLGLRVPADFANQAARDGGLGGVPLPVVAKLRHERGGSTVEVLHTEDALAKHLQVHANEVFMYQELVEGQGTLAHCGFFIGGEPVAEFQHHETRSVPRIGGSGTRLRSIQNAELRDQARALLRELRWTGLAQVEFKRASSGELVLMEINPKLWASYALASQAGPPLVAAAAAHALGRPLQAFQADRWKKMHMAFPMREYLYVRKNGGALDALLGLGAMLAPPVRWDIELSDLRGYLQSI